MKRDEVLDFIYSARTMGECKQAWLVRDEYLRLHPDDIEILDAGESLSLVEQILSEQNAELLVTAS